MNLRGNMKINYLISVCILILISILSIVALKTQSNKESPQWVQGFDVSHYQGTVQYYQGTVQWDQINPDTKIFAIAKATGGTDFIDPDFQINWNGMKEQGFIRGAYHFFYPQDDASQQAKNYLANLGTLQKTDLPPILNVEVANGLASEVIVNKVLVWLTEVEKTTQRRPMIYSDLNFAQTYLTDERLSIYPLWIADYGDSVGSLPLPWSTSSWSLWQYSDKGSVLGIQGPVDLDEFNGNKEALKAFIESTVL